MIQTDPLSFLKRPLIGAHRLSAAEQEKAFDHWLNFDILLVVFIKRLDGVTIHVPRNGGPITTDLKKEPGPKKAALEVRDSDWDLEKPKRADGSIPPPGDYVHPLQDVSYDVVKQYMAGFLSQTLSKSTMSLPQLQGVRRIQQEFGRAEVACTATISCTESSDKFSIHFAFRHDK